MSEQIRVLFAIGSVGGGGAERQTLSYLRHLDRGCFAPALYLHYRQGELLSEVPEDVPVYSFWGQQPPLRWNYPGRIHRLQVQDLARVLAQERVDVLCAVTFLMCLVAAPATRRRPTPWLAIEMADPRLDFAHQVARYRRLKQWLLGRAYRRAGLAVAVSEGVRAGLRECYAIPEEKLTLLPNFIDLERVDYRQQDPAPAWAADGLFHIVSVGRLDLQKGHIYLLQALDELVRRRGRRQVRLHLLGQGPVEQELKDFVREAGLSDFVEFAGFVSNPLPAVKAGQLFCLPSLYEGLPLALLEALACRTPVLATDCPSGPYEVLQGGRCGGLVPPRDPLALTAAIEDALDNYTRWLARAALGRHRVENEYCDSVGMAKLTAAIDALVRNKVRQ